MAKLRFKDNAPKIKQFHDCIMCCFNAGMVNKECLTCVRHYKHEARTEGVVDNFKRNENAIEWWGPDTEPSIDEMLAMEKEREDAD